MDAGYGLTQSSATNLTNTCVIKLMNMLAQLVANIEKLKDALSEELD